MKQIINFLIKFFSGLKPAPVAVTPPAKVPDSQIIVDQPVVVAPPVVPEELPVPADPLEKVWSECRKHYELMGYKCLPINIVFVSGVGLDGKPNTDTPGKWNDLCFIAEFQDGRWVFPYRGVCTTTPGVLPTKSGRALQRGGVAMIMPGQYEAWQEGFHRPSKYGTSHPALVQCAPITISRDFNQDFSRVNDRVYVGVFGINLHSTALDLNPKDVNGWSEGCAVNLSFEHFQKNFMGYLKISPNRKKMGKSAIFAATFIEGKVLNLN